MISVSGIEKGFGDRVLFSGASFQLNAGERYGLVGANGSGKTTFLGILAGDIDASDGVVSLPKRVRLGVLRQDQFLYEDEAILGVAMMGNPDLWKAMVEKEALLARAEDHFDADRFSELEEIVQQHDGYAAEARAAAILEGLGLPAEIHRDPLSTLSGGFKLRVLLAQVLASDPDALLLDEPTNHLDILSIRWLEKFLRDFRGPVVVISHDHRFLDNVATHILDVDYETITLYPGDYTRFVKAKEEERERREKEIASREKEIAHHQKFVDRFRAKASKARQAQSKLRLIEKKADSLEELPQSSRRYPTFRFASRRPSGREVLSVDGISKAYGTNQVLSDVELQVVRGDRLAIMGPNGIGKSTLLKIAVGALDADAGSVEWGYETHPGYFAQDHNEQFESPNRSAEAFILDYCASGDIGVARGALGQVLFSGDDAKKRLDALSGGEAARLVFCSLALQRPNVLVLDEPTNHLDLESIESLVEGLRDYDGTLIFVSHDRWFVGQLANRIVEITPDGIQDYRGTYEEYVAHCGDDHLDVAQVLSRARQDKRKDSAPDPKEKNSGRATAPRGSPRPRPPKVNRERLSRRRDEVTARIERVESRTNEIDRIFAGQGYFDSAAPEEIRDLQEERDQLQSELTDLMSEWEDLERRLDPS
ncbi:MAG: ABC-F family ATP-binding cassette domain-containing protein [Gemmatimonadetes bacterium]|nr:ABC-F family ATP-binding cassette domain-containing protein [Gemmatimonadota bacterium]